MSWVSDNPYAQQGVGVLANYASSVLTRYGVGSAPGRGRMAARGAAAAAADFARLQAGVEGLRSREAMALQAFEAQNPGGSGSIVEFNPDPRVKKLAEKIISVRQNIDARKAAGKKARALIAKERALEKKVAKRELRTAANVDVRVADLYGPNAGFWQERGAPPPAFLLRGGF